MTPGQRRIVEWGDGPVVVIAGAGTGKTRVIVERVRWLLETKGAATNPVDPLLPEHLLVLTYNVKATKQLQDRLPSGGIEVIDYKTGQVTLQKGVDESLQLSIYALACRDALGLGTPERVTLYFTESALRLSTTRTDDQLDAARADVLARVSRMRAGEFGATPGRVCEWCDYRAMCPERV